MSQAGTPALRNGDRFKVRIFSSLGTVLAQLAGRSPNAKRSSFAPTLLKIDRECCYGTCNVERLDPL